MIAIIINDPIMPIPPIVGVYCLYKCQGTEGEIGCPTLFPSIATNLHIKKEMPKEIRFKYSKLYQPKLKGGKNGN
jgi:hypothetical protein